MNDDYYCEFKKECIKDNCDCMYEEWHRMSEQNVILCNKINKAIEYIEKGQESALNSLINGISNIEIISFKHIIDILKGEDK